MLTAVSVQANQAKKRICQLDSQDKTDELFNNLKTLFIAG